jgi:nucleoside 2-deoxyribosyltransferase
MPTCFVMQPFDGGVFDRRFEEVFKPAIEAAGLEAYRVDQDPKVSIPIQDIEAGIRSAQVCLADITHDNPNVWFELGFAIACNKQVVLVCSDERTATKFPFDVQHRTIIKYPTKSPSDFTTLSVGITAKLVAYLEKSESMATVSSMSLLTTTNGLDKQEVVAIAAVAQNVEHSADHASIGQIRRDMEASGSTRLAIALALRSLVERGFLAGEFRQDEDQGYYGYELTPDGWRWAVENKNMFVLQQAKPGPKTRGY